MSRAYDLIVIGAGSGDAVKVYRSRFKALYYGVLWRSIRPAPRNW